MAIKTIQTNFLVAQASALVLDAAMASEANVRGLTGLTLPLGFEMSTITVSEMGRRIDLIVPSGGAYTSIDITANFVPGDPTQQALQDAALNSSKITTMRFYLKAGCDFAALDLINDPGGSYLIGTYSPPTVASKSELYTNSISILPAGSSVLYVAHTPPNGGANLTFSAGAVATGVGSFVDYGFEVGDVCLIDYNDANDPLYVEVETVTATDMTFVAGVGDVDDITVGAGTQMTALHSATPIEVTGLDTTCD